MSANNGSVQFRRNVSVANLIAVLAALLWGVDGYKVMPTANAAAEAGVLIVVALIACVVITKAMRTIQGPESTHKNAAVIMVVLSSFVLAAIAWVVYAGWGTHEPRHAFAGMATVLAFGYHRWCTRVRKDELPTREQDHQDAAQADECELADV